MAIKDIVWAIDAESNDAKVNKTVGRLLKALKKHNSNLNCHVVSVLSLGDFGFYEVLTPQEVKELTKNTKEQAQELVKAAGVKELDPDVVKTKSRSGRDTVSALMKYVKKHKSDLVVIGSHHKKAVERFFLGSFAENFLFSTQQTALVVHPDSKVPQEIKRALIPLDFFEGYETEFDRAAEMAKSLGIQELHVYHYLGLGKGSKRQADIIQEKIAEREKALNDLSKRVSGIKVVPHLQNEKKEVDDDILKHVNKTKSQMVIAKGKTGRVKSLFLGSTTRSVVRHSPVPVLVFH